MTDKEWIDFKEDAKKWLMSNSKLDFMIGDCFDRHYFHNGYIAWREKYNNDINKLKTGILEHNDIELAIDLIDILQKTLDKCENNIFRLEEVEQACRMKDHRIKQHQFWHKKSEKQKTEQREQEDKRRKKISETKSKESEHFEEFEDFKKFHIEQCNDNNKSYIKLSVQFKIIRFHQEFEKHKLVSENEKLSRAVEQRFRRWIKKIENG